MKLKTYFIKLYSRTFVKAQYWKCIWQCACVRVREICVCWCRNELGLSTHSLALDVHFKLVQLQSFCWTKSWVRFRGPHQAVSVSHCRQGWCWKGSCEGSSQGWEQGPRFGGQEPPSGDAQTPGGRIPWERGSPGAGAAPQPFGTWCERWKWHPARTTGKPCLFVKGRPGAGQLQLGGSAFVWKSAPESPPGLQINAPELLRVPVAVGYTRLASG